MMNLEFEPICKLLLQYLERHSDEREKVAAFFDLLEKEPNCLHRSCQRGHLTGSGVVLNGAGTHLLLIHHRKLGIWVQPGGHADGESDIRAVAFREVWEETGLRDLVSVDTVPLDLDIHEIPARNTEPAHLHFDLRFLFRATGEENLIANEETYGARWVQLDQVSSLTSEDSVLRLALRAGRDSSPTGERSPA